MATGQNQPQESEPRRRPRLRKQPHLRKQPRRRSAAAPRVVMPKTANKRRRRNRWRTPFTKSSVKGFFFSSRWISALLLVFSIGALYLMGDTATFYLYSVPVEGAHAALEGDIIAASGLYGAHIFAADPTAAAERISEIPGVISAVVTLSWPNEVMIVIEEDTPVALWRDKGKLYWITDSGTFMEARGQTEGLLVVESEVQTAVSQVEVDDVEEDGEETAVTPPSSSTSLAFMPQPVLDGALMLRELRPNIDQLYYRPAGGLSYQDGRGWRAYFGEGTDMNQKLVVYEAIVADLESRGLTPAYISVSNQEKPYYAAR